MEKILEILVNRGDYETIEEAREMNEANFAELEDLIENDPMEAEDFFTSTFALEPDYFFDLLI
jgi:uncharacterized protein YggE